MRWVQLCGSLSILWHCLSLGLEWKRTFSSPCGHCWIFQICWHIKWSTFTASSFRIWNSSTGIPSPPLALFVVMLPKAYLTSHSRMSSPRWVITPLWLSGSWRSFLYSSSVYSYHLFLISSVSVKVKVKVKSLSHVQLFATPWTVAYQPTFLHGILQARILEWVAISFSSGSSGVRDRTWVSCTASVSHITFLSFILPVFARNVPLISLIFLKRSLVFPILLFSSISLH